MADIKYIINNIVYCDKVIRVSNVDKSFLEECLKIIRKSNPCVKFITIQYSDSDQTVYFYTNVNLCTQAWQDNKFAVSKSITSGNEISKEVKKILVSETRQDYNWISLYDVANLIKKVSADYNEMKEHCYYYSALMSILDSKWKFPMVKIDGFDYDHNELVIRINYIGNIFDEIKFTKQNEKLFITQTATYNGEQYVIKSKTSLYDENILTNLCPQLSMVYDQFLKYKDFFKQHNYSIKAKNSQFLVDISDCGVGIVSEPYENDFRLSFLNFTNGYKYDCNPSIVPNLQGKEDELFKKIFIDIDDCPEWSQSTLYEIRRSQLLKQQRREHPEKEKQNKLELVRKLFPVVLEFLDNLD